MNDISTECTNIIYEISKNTNKWEKPQNPKNSI